MYKAKIQVLLKKSILDPQGQAVEKSLSALGYNKTKDVRIGRYIELIIDDTELKRAEDELRNICEALLVNPVIEYYKTELEEIEKKS